jgi:hypothetical protein
MSNLSEFISTGITIWVSYNIIDYLILEDIKINKYAFAIGCATIIGFSIYDSFIR